MAALVEAILNFSSDRVLKHPGWLSKGEMH
jgi:hypothetical protein